MKETGSLRPALSLMAVALGLGLQACVPRAYEDEPVTREPVRWIVVERRYGDLKPNPDAGDGTINPDAIVLGFQPLYPEDLTWEVVINPEEHFVELIGYSPSGPVAPGEVVSATVRVGKARDGATYRLSAKPSHSNIRLLGETEAVVKGKDSAVFRFTSCASGRAGIAVTVDSIRGGVENGLRFVR